MGGKSDGLGDLAVSIHLRIKGFSILVGYSRGLSDMDDEPLAKMASR